MKRLSYVALVSSMLAACANPYELKLNSINMEAAQKPGVIQFSDPKLYKREALINERKGERTYLNKLLDKTENDDFKIEPEIVRELEKVQEANGDGYLSALEGGREVFAEVARGEIRSEKFDLNGLWAPWYTLHKLFAGLRRRGSPSTCRSSPTAHGAGGDVLPRRMARPHLRDPRR